MHAITWHILVEDQGLPLGVMSNLSSLSAPGWVLSQKPGAVPHSAVNKYCIQWQSTPGVKTEMVFSQDVERNYLNVLETELFRYNQVLESGQSDAVEIHGVCLQRWRCYQSSPKAPGAT